MRRGRVTRRIAAAILVVFAGLLMLAVAPLLFDVRIDDAVRRGANLLASKTTAFIVDEPMRLSASPSIVLTAGTLTSASSPHANGAAARLFAPTVEVSIDGTRWSAAADALQAGTQRTNTIPQVLLPLIDAFSSAEMGTVYVQGGTVKLNWSDGQTLLISGLEAEITTKSKSNLSASGQFLYLGQPVKFEISNNSRADVSAQSKRLGSWPLKLVLRSPWLTVVADGVFDYGENLSYAAHAEVQTPDIAKLAAWLGHDWRSQGAGPAMLLRGPVNWAKGAVAFGRSQISLSDQEGVGAVSLSYRENRPLIEATVAFPALDVAPLLYSQPESEKAPKAGTAQVNSSPPTPLWRCLSTNFAAAVTIDADLRLSAARLQWRGDPVGKGAFSVSSRNGMVHADFSELSIGPYSGSLQIATDRSSADAPVTLRGRFQTANLGSLAQQIFGAAVVSGTATSQFEISGRGSTLGAVIDSANGRGGIDARDGQLQLSLAAMQKFVGTPSENRGTIGWNSISAPSVFETMAVKFQVRKGALIIDEGGVRSNAITASVRGRIGLADGDVDVRIRLEPNSGDGAAPRLAAVRPAIPATRAPHRAGDALAIIGPWSAPALSVVSSSSFP